ncbi:MAG TPA: hypothetical protein VFB60_01065, partial [Ktedonobacteraceae bacterium]|nr:hypothetical protein [Ktedonobacteraceae bacterium]
PMYKFFLPPAAASGGEKSGDNSLARDVPHTPPGAAPLDPAQKAGQRQHPIVTYTLFFQNSEAQSEDQVDRMGKWLSV